MWKNRGFTRVEGEEDCVKEGFSSAIQLRLQESELQKGEGRTDGAKQKRLVMLRVRWVAGVKGRGTHDSRGMLRDLSRPSTKYFPCWVAAPSSRVDKLSRMSSVSVDSENVLVSWKLISLEDGTSSVGPQTYHFELGCSSGETSSTFSAMTTR